MAALHASEMDVATLAGTLVAMRKRRTTRRVRQG
jgi:hypothetical protein